MYQKGRTIARANEQDFKYKDRDDVGWRTRSGMSMTTGSKHTVTNSEIQTARNMKFWRKTIFCTNFWYFVTSMDVGFSRISNRVRGRPGPEGCRDEKRTLAKISLSHNVQTCVSCSGNPARHPEDWRNSKAHTN
jgi:hypothetical protein